MGLDVRLPVGLLFSAIGVALMLYGAMSAPAIYERSLGINLNLTWGAVLLVFGLMMLALGMRGRKTASARAHRGDAVAR